MSQQIVMLLPIWKHHQDRRRRQTAGPHPNQIESKIEPQLTSVYVS